jgi:hypothetical protein
MLPLEQIIKDAQTSIAQRNINLPFPQEGEIRSCTLIYIAANNAFEPHLIDAQFQDGNWKIIRIDEKDF